MKICTLMSGSSGNAIYIETKKTKVLIDAGQAGKRLSQALEEGCGVKAGELDAILVTHAHRDHVLGAGIMSRRYDLPLYATEGTWCEMESLIGPVVPKRRYYIDTQRSWEIGDIKIEPFPTSHDALEPVGLICSSGQKRLGIATDSGVFTTRMANVLNDLDCFVLEANHDVGLLNNGPYPWSLKKRIASVLGHLSNNDAGQALLKTCGGNTKNVILAHLSEENNRPSLALETVRETLVSNKVSIKDIDITVAPRHRPGCLLSI